MSDYWDNVRKAFPPFMYIWRPALNPLLEVPEIVNSINGDRVWESIAIKNKIKNKNKQITEENNRLISDYNKKCAINRFWAEAHGRCNLNSCYGE